MFRLGSCNGSQPACRGVVLLGVEPDPMKARNTSQDPEYEGPVYHEKKFHKTHFHVAVKLKLRTTRDNGYECVRVGEGRYKRIKKEKQNGKS